MSTLSNLTEAVKKGKRDDTKSLTSQALEEKAAPDEILGALVSGMDDVGRRFKANEIFVPEVLVAARAMKEAMGILEPVLAEAGIKPEHTAVIGTVQGDLHDIGKNLVAMMWRGANYNVVDLGTNVPAEQFAQAAKENAAAVVGVSALLTTTMPAMKDAVAAVNEATGGKSKVVIGGAPVTQEYADEIGAAGYAPDAASAVDLVRQLVSA